MNKTALICGASQGIGLAITKQLISDNDFDLIISTHRKLNPNDPLAQLQTSFPNKLRTYTLEAESEKSFLELATAVKKLTKSVDLLINCVGFLYDENTKPERSIEEVTQSSLAQSFLINTIPTLLLAKHFKSLLLKKNKSVFAVLSAKVGSIEDNKSGGWHSYRASKAALNMCIKNISIEFNRLNNSCTVFAIHPGTTDTQLSKPFLKSAKKKYIIHKPESTAMNILKITSKAENKIHNGNFFSWDETPIPW